MVQIVVSAVYQWNGLVVHWTDVQCHQVPSDCQRSTPQLHCETESVVDASPSTAASNTSSTWQLSVITLLTHAQETCTCRLARGTCTYDMLFCASVFLVQDSCIKQNAALSHTGLYKKLHRLAPKFDERNSCIVYIKFLQHVSGVRLCFVHINAYIYNT